MIRWFHRADFWSDLETRQPSIPLDYDDWCFFHIPLETLRLKIGHMEPNQDLTGEGDEPGPVSRWYGEIEGVPFLLDFHHEHPLGEVAVLVHGIREGARDVIRNTFSTWGDHWQESHVG